MFIGDTLNYSANSYYECFQVYISPHWLQEEFDGREHIGNPKTPSCLCKSLTISQNAS